jgi:hypothetical protein
MRPAQSKASRITTTDPSVDVLRWVSKRLHWERFLAEASAAVSGPADATGTIEPRAA